MPQMAPMSWMIIYIYFISIMMMFILKIYFNKKSSIKIIKNYKKMNINKNWMW
nr:ATP synthase F0 subunit 8 [Peruphasma schultei]